jgi:parallel beta-helix repeat protein
MRGGSDGAVVRHCVIANAATADGIRVDSSSDVLLFNNLVFAADRGIVVTGSAKRTQIINNSIALTDRAGISLRASGGAEPSDTQVINNVLQETGPSGGIDASGGTEGYAGDYNLVFQPEAEDPAAVYNPPEVRGANDLNVDPLIVNIAAGDLHLEPDSPAVDSGSGRIDAALEEALLARSTNPDGSRDRAPVDRGYHYPR